MNMLYIKFQKKSRNFICKLADIRDFAKIEEIIKYYKPDIIFHRVH